MVNKILWGNHDSQVQLYLYRRLNESTFTEDVVVFVELYIRKKPYCNVYADPVIVAIKRNLTKEKIEEAFRCKPT
ncbi:RNase P protein component [Desulfofundulus luciae]|uniref:RNase P protein component n=1 Tax=Desulfofundulus luciae TaxID=74702 RepID=A0ABU0AZY7_9FIRM|nr:RNase P protein component [Desulfofundulus luciae]